MSLVRSVALLLMLLATGCGYHLVGHGGGQGAIPADVETLTITGNAEPKLLLRMRQQLQSKRYRIVDSAPETDAEHHATLIVRLTTPRFTPSAYDRSGIATQYRMLVSGTLQVERGGETIWQSGAIQRQGDVFVTGGPTSIEASRKRLQEDLTRTWLNDATGRIRSGF